MCFSYYFDLFTILKHWGRTGETHFSGDSLLVEEIKCSLKVEPLVFNLGKARCHTELGPHQGPQEYGSQIYQYETGSWAKYVCISSHKNRQTNKIRNKTKNKSRKVTNIEISCRAMNLYVDNIKTTGCKCCLYFFWRRDATRAVPKLSEYMARA